MSLVTVSVEFAIELASSAKFEATLFIDSRGTPIVTAPENVLVINAYSRTIDISDEGPEGT